MEPSFADLLEKLESPRNIKDPRGLLQILSEMVRSEASRQASVVNNSGWRAQLVFLKRNLPVPYIYEKIASFMRSDEDDDDDNDSDGV